MILRRHRKWIKSLQTFLDTYKPFKYYAGEQCKHGIAFQPVMIDLDGYYKGKFVWFVDREDMNNTYGWVEIKCEGNYYAKTMNVNEFRLHVSPKEGGEVLKFNPFKLSIDDDWNAQLLEEMYSSNDQDDNAKKEKLLNKKRPIFRNKKPSKVDEAEYKIK